MKEYKTEYFFIVLYKIRTLGQEKEEENKNTEF